MTPTPTPEEQKAIAALKRLAKKWPKSLWLFSASGTLWVMRKDASGRRAVTPQEGIDPEYSLDSIAIENDGGDW